MSRLFLLRYRKGSVGATSAYIEILKPSDDPVINQRIAEEVGQRFCDSTFNTKYIRVEPAVVADESILDPKRLKDLLHPPKAKPVKLSAEEQEWLDRQSSDDPSGGTKPLPPTPAPVKEDAAEEPDEEEVRPRDLEEAELADEESSDADEVEEPESDEEAEVEEKPKRRASKTASKSKSKKR